MSDPRPFAASGFFALRSPLLPVEALEDWMDGSRLADLVGCDRGVGLEGLDDETLAEALAADRSSLRERLVALVETPEVAEALFVASPDFHQALVAWRERPNHPDHARVEAALVRYVLRMITRATPFGLFSGCSVGTLTPPEAPKTRLDLAPRTDAQRHSRLDNDYLFALGEALSHGALADELPVFPNSTLYRVAGRLRYAESRLAGRRRTYHLVAVDPDPYLDATLERARGGASPRELARALADDLAREAAEEGWDDDEVPTLDEVRDYVGELMASQLLVPELSPPVTGEEPVHDLVAQLSRLPGSETAQEAARRLDGARQELARLDARGIGSTSPERYREIAAALEPLGTEVELARLFQVDLMKPARHLELGPGVVEEIDRAVELIHRIQPATPTGGRLEEFARAFVERYEDGRLVPLSEVLDEEMGIGFERQANVLADASPVLQGLPWGGAAGPAPGTVPWGAGWAHLLERLRQVWTDGSRVLELTDRDVERLTHPDPRPLPDAFVTRVEIAARDTDAIGRGEYRLLLGFVGGPSGANLLGRFCHASPELARRVREHLADEQAHDREAIYAEIVHLPEGRIGNVLSRPVLRSHEIPFLGRSGAPSDRQIPVGDLLVTVTGGTVQLWSKGLGCRVHPRLTTAHNYSRESLGLYRFLASLQTQGVAPGLQWSWGALEAAAFLPRVTRGRLVLARARWSVPAEELSPVREAADIHGTDSAPFSRAVETWRRGRGIDRRVAVADGDHELLVDFAHPLVVASFYDLVKNRPKFELVEIYPPLDELPTRSPEGRFVAEILVPYVRRRPEANGDASGESGEPVDRATPAPDQERRAPAADGSEPVRRIFPVGSSWAYAKLYTGSSTADRVLTQVIAPVRRAVLASGAARSWFFIRYGDPAWHLRVRFQGEPERLLGEVLPVLRDHLEAAGGERLVWRFQLDTYEREVERYGGPGGIELAEELFAVDSDAVLALAALLEGDAGADERWRLALYGVDRLMADFGLDLAARERFARRHREAFARRFRVEGSGFTRALAPKLRGERRELDRLLFGERPHPELEPGLAVLDERSRRGEPLVAELLRRTGDGRIPDPPEALLASLVHMFVNRLTRSGGPEHEMVIYDFLSQLYASRRARERAMAMAKAKAKKRQKT